LLKLATDLTISEQVSINGAGRGFLYAGDHGRRDYRSSSKAGAVCRVYAFVETDKGRLSRKAVISAPFICKPPL
jgi:hypothetical protein